MQQIICKWQNRITILSNCVKRKPKGNSSHATRKCNLLYNFLLYLYFRANTLIFTYSFNKYLLNTCSVPGTTLGVGDKVVNEIKSLTLSLHSSWGRYTVNKCIFIKGLSAMDKKKIRGEWRHQDGNLGCSWLCFPSQEEQLTSNQERDTAERILVYGGEAEVPFCSTETQTDCIRRVRSGYALLLLQSIAALCREVSREPSVPPMGKENPLGTIITPPYIGAHFVRIPTLISHHGDFRGICGAQPLGIWLWWRRGNGLKHLV